MSWRWCDAMNKLYQGDEMSGEWGCSREAARGKAKAELFQGNPEREFDDFVHLSPFVVKDVLSGEFLGDRSNSKNDSGVLVAAPSPTASWVRSFAAICDIRASLWLLKKMKRVYYSLEPCFCSEVLYTDGERRQVTCVYSCVQIVHKFAYKLSLLDSALPGENATSNAVVKAERN
jgi:hypothetical protein